jgi:hypothetical protein
VRGGGSMGFRSMAFCTGRVEFAAQSYYSGFRGMGVMVLLPRQPRCHGKGNLVGTGQCRMAFIFTTG